MDLSNFCPTANIKQYKVCPALNFVYGCLEGLDIKFYFYFLGGGPQMATMKVHV
jgi:hypothetical protein